ncbi:hypothetical protein [Paenibacillus humicus]|uniref:hypothetical protein n=1 Tax=Paenibacillus humicus TaxID=412861 RepID=UPI000FDB53AC|nr:hypothetical protein [Paenibacillus humicus]
MSKLDGNERWKSKMLLTEHVEGYTERHTTETPTTRAKAVPSSEELAMIRDHIMLPFMMTMVQKSVDDIERSTNVLRRLYAQAGRAILDQISADHFVIRRDLKQRNIRVIPYETDSAAAVINYEYYCRGYRGEFGMIREHLRSQIAVRLAKYTADLGAAMRGGQ